MPTTKKWKTEKKLEIKKTGVLRSIGKQSGESAESVPKKKKRKVTVGRICRKGRFSVWKERMRGWRYANNNKYKC